MEVEDIILYVFIFCGFFVGWLKIIQIIDARKRLYNLVYYNHDYVLTEDENNDDKDFTGNENNDLYDWRQDPYYFENVTETGEYKLFDMTLDLDNVTYV